jgi:hypothetical protein
VSLLAIRVGEETISRPLIIGRSGLARFLPLHMAAHVFRLDASSRAWRQG